MSQPRPTILILTGEIGVGKSTACERAVALAQSAGFICRGIITLRRGPRTLDVLDVGSGRARRLTSEGDSPGAIVQGPYRFDPATFAWGNDLLRDAAPCDLLVVDELGPVELERGGGWTAAFAAITSSGCRWALVVVRPWLVDQALDVFGPVPTEVLAVTWQNRDSIPELIATKVVGA